MEEFRAGSHEMPTLRADASRATNAWEQWLVSSVRSDNSKPWESIP